MTSVLDPLAERAERGSHEETRPRSRAELEQQLGDTDAHEPLRGLLHEVEGVRALVHAVARRRGTARIELVDASVVVELHLTEAELVDAMCTTSEGELVRGALALEHALRMETGTFEVHRASAKVRRTLLDPLAALIGPAIVEARVAPAFDPHDGAVQAIAVPAAPSDAPPPSSTAAIDETGSNDPRRIARLADVVVTFAFVGVGMIASILGLIDAVPDTFGDALAGENRAAAELPELTWSNVLEGRYTGAFEAYLADRIPGRGGLLEGEAALRRARGFAPDEEDLVLYAVSSEALDLGADAEADLDVDEGLPTDFGAPPPRLDEPTAEDASDATLDGAPGVASDGASDPEVPAIAPPARRRRRVATRVTSGILIRDGRAMQGFGGDPGGAPEYARTLNAIHEALRGRATVYAAIVPTAQEFYLPHGARSRGRPERPNILATYARLVPGIRRVDVHAELAAHTDENIYFRTDHHWTGLGAYYGYRAFCRAAGLEPVPLERMERRVIHRSWLGSLHRLTRDPTLRPDRVEIAVPRVEAAARVQEDDGEEHAVPLFDERYHGYGVFLSGDHPIMRVRTSTQNGRRAIVVKNSYGNAFAVYLISNYEEVTIIDYRYFHGRLHDVVDESEAATDIVFMNGALTANSRAHTGFLRRLLDGRR